MAEFVWSGDYLMFQKNQVAKVKKDKWLELYEAVIAFYSLDCKESRKLFKTRLEAEVWAEKTVQSLWTKQLEESFISPPPPPPKDCSPWSGGRGYRWSD